MYILLEYGSNYCDIIGSLWLYSKGEASNFNIDIANENAFISFSYKTGLWGKAVADRVD